MNSAKMMRGLSAGRMAYLSRTGSAVSSRTGISHPVDEWEDGESSSEDEEGNHEQGETFYTEVHFEEPLPGKEKSPETSSVTVSESKDDTESVDSSPDYETDLEDRFEEEIPLRDLTGAALYEKLCERIGIVPQSVIRRNMNAPCFNLPHRGIGVRGVEALAPPVTKSPHVREMNLENNMIGPEGCEFLATLVNACGFITELNLAYNQMGSEGAAILSAPLRDSSSLVVVNLSNNQFEDRDAEYFADIIENNISIKNLNLSKNLLSIEAGKVLGPAVANNDTIETLDLSWNALRLEGAQAFAKGLAANLGLKTLNLSMNGFSTDGTRAVGIALSLNKYLEHLDLSLNRISNAAAADFARYFKINTTLKTLKLYGNPIMYDGCMEILKTVSENERCGLYHLDFSGLMVHQDFVDLATSMNAEKPFKADIGVVSHGTAVQGTIDRFADKNPLEILLIFMGEQGLRLVDLFRSFDKDQSGGLTRDEFIVGLQEIKTPLSRSQLDELLDMLDKDGDGEIDLKEILNINREYRDIKLKAARFVQEEKLQKKLEKEGKKETELGAFTKEALAMKQRSQTTVGFAIDQPEAGQATADTSETHADQPAVETVLSAEEAPHPPATAPAATSEFKVTAEEAADLNQQVKSIKTKGVLGLWKNKALV